MTAKYRLELRQSFLRFDKELEAFTAEAKKNGGASLAILSAPVTSPTEERLRAELVKNLPKASFAYWEALTDDNSAEALRLFRGAANPDARLRVDLTKVDTIVSLDADFMSASYRDSLELVRGWATRRKVSGKKEDAEKIDLNRLWSVEANFSLTGSNADHRLRVKPSQVGDVLVLVAQKLASGPLKGLSLPAFDSKLKLDAQSAKDVTYAAAIDALATELTSNAAKGRRSVILCGESQPVNVQVLALLINSALGAFANGSLSVVPAAAKADKLLSSSIAELAEGIKSGRITQLVIVGGNPAYDAPAELGFADLVAKAKTIHLTHDFNESSEKAAIAVPAAHWLESWGDTRASDGSVALIQPLIAPLFDGISANELLARLTGLGKIKGHDLLKATHGLQGRDFDAVLAKGLISGPAAPLAVVPDLAGCGQVLATLKAGEPAEYEVVFVPCAKMLDGRYANNAWLQELPEPITKIAWDNAALVSMATARKLGAAHRRSNGIDETDVLMVKVGGAVAELPVWPVPASPMASSSSPSATAAKSSAMSAAAKKARKSLITRSTTASRLTPSASTSTPSAAAARCSRPRPIASPKPARSSKVATVPPAPRNTGPWKTANWSKPPASPPSSTSLSLLAKKRTRSPRLSSPAASNGTFPAATSGPWSST